MGDGLEDVQLPVYELLLSHLPARWNAVDVTRFPHHCPIFSFIGLLFAMEVYVTSCALTPAYMLVGL